MKTLPNDVQVLLKILEPSTPKMKITIESSSETVVSVQSDEEGTNRITVSSSSEVRVVERPRGKK